MAHELTQEQIDDLKASFDMFDKDSSGKSQATGERKSSFKDRVAKLN